MITAQEVNSLRQQTGVGMMECKKALVEADGDVDKAIELLRKRGQKISAARAQRETTEGLVLTSRKDNNTHAVMVALACETDFVSRSEAFTALAQRMIAAAAAHSCADADELLNVSIDGLPLSQHLSDLIAKVGEKIHIAHYITMEAEHVAAYVHAGKIGVLLALSGGNTDTKTQVGKDLAMQIAAMNPIAVDEQHIDPATLQKEKEIGKELASKQNKPDHVLDKIAEGYVKKFVKTNTLLHQPYVKDSNLSVAQYIKQVDASVQILRFARIEIGA